MATTIDSRTTAGRSLPQASDLLLVQRGSTPYRATADEVKAFMLSPATAAAIGAIKPGTNFSVDSDGTLHAATSGALTYRGGIDPTTTEAPAGAAVGDVLGPDGAGVIRIQVATAQPAGDHMSLDLSTLPAAALAELLNPPQVMAISGVFWSTVR